MSAPINLFVDVTINLTGAVAAKFGFGSPIGVFDHSVTANRIDGPFVDIAGVNAAGFTSAAAPEINAEASAAFAQTNGVDQILIGRRVPTLGAQAGQVWQVAAIGPVFSEQTAGFNDATSADWVVFPAAEAIGDYAAIGYPSTFSQVSLDNLSGTAGTVGTVDWEYWNGAAWSALAGVADGTSGFTAAVADGQVVSWTVPGDWAAQSLNGGPSLFYVRAVVTVTYTIDPIYDQGFVDGAGDATWTATMDAIELFQQVNGTANFYGVNIESRIKADILEVGAWTQARTKVFSYQTADADALAGTPGNVFDDMKALGHTRSFGIYHATSSGSADGYLDSAWLSKGLGLNLDVPGGVGIWGLMELAGISGDNITPTQVLAMLADNGNVYTDAGGLTFTSTGITAAGVPQFIDVTTSVDWLKQRTQEAILSLLVGSQTKIPYTDGGINQVVSAWQGVLDSGVNFGHLSPDDPPKISAPLVSSVSSADKAARVLTMTAEATLAGAIQKVTLILNLSF